MDQRRQRARLHELMPVAVVLREVRQGVCRVLEHRRVLGGGADAHERRQRPGSGAEYDSGGGGGSPRGPRVRVMQLFRSQEAEVG